ncbi:MAG: hypothetical protein AAF391_11705 [Bacteroidota bacterium]
MADYALPWKHGTMNTQVNEKERKFSSQNLQEFVTEGKIRLFGYLEEEEQSELLEKLLEGFKDSTKKALVSRIRKFYQFCEEHPRKFQPVPATNVTIYAYIHWLEKDNQVNPQSAPAYLSAISTLHSLNGFTEWSAFDTTSKRLLASWRSRVGTLKDLRVETYPEDFYRNLLAFLPNLEGHELRVALYVLLMTIFFSRMDSMVDVLRDDLEAKPDLTIHFVERRFKGRDRNVIRTREYDASQTLELHQALLKLRKLTEGGRYAFRLPGDVVNNPGTKEFKVWLSEALVLTGIDAKALLHSLRKTGATLAFQAGVTLPRIAHWGGWSTNSKSIWKYINLDLGSSSLGKVFFHQFLVSTDPVPLSVFEVSDDED